MPKVELRIAFVWVCEGCDAKQYEDAVVFEPGKHKEQQMVEDYNLSGGGNFFATPETVKCETCKREYEVEAFDQSGGGDDWMEGLDDLKNLGKGDDEEGVPA